MSTISLTKTPAPAVPAEEAAEPPLEPLHTQRVELILALPDHKPLAVLGLTPDPLQQLATALGAVNTLDGETADLVIDLVPVPDRTLARHRRRLLTRARRQGPGGQLTGASWGLAGIAASFRSAWNGGTGTGGAAPRGGSERLPRMDARDALGKFTPGHQVFAVQVLLRTQARHPQAALARMHQLLAAVAATSGENYFKTHRPRSRRAIADFDRRLASAEFAPKRRQWVTVPEIAPWLKPPTRHCHASSVVRSGGLVPPAPAGLPVYTGQADLVPLGAVVYPDGVERIGAVPARDFLFALSLGKSGHGKTEQALVQAIALAHNGHGTWFLDPHGEAWIRARPYLSHPQVMDRLWLIDLAKVSDDRQPVVSWNPLSMEGKTKSDVQDVVRCVVEGIAAAMDWGDHAPRARTILARTAQALALLNLQAVQAGRPEAQCTLFQVRSWLTDDDWRLPLQARLPRSARAYWESTFPTLPRDATPTVTYAIDRLDTSQSLQAFFGNPRSGYDARTAMDQGKIVFVCPSGSEADAIVSCLLIHDLHRAGLSRQDTPRRLRRTFWAWIDELTALDASSKGFLAAICEQLRKYEVRLTGMTQMALRLSAITRQALLQNQSVLSTCAADIDESEFVAKRWGGLVEPETITELPKYHYVMSVTLDGVRTTPFRVRGLPVEEVYAHYDNPDGIPDLEAAIDANMSRRPAGKILDSLDRLDSLIAAHHVSPSTRRRINRG